MLTATCVLANKPDSARRSVAPFNAQAGPRASLHVLTYVCRLDHAHIVCTIPDA